eukprot:m.227743 g.227743  ORF g.227743 m.227743 type:complete len:70 (+) comp26416_c0_seq12:2064-2273(+)
MLLCKSGREGEKKSVCGRKKKKKIAPFSSPFFVFLSPHICFLCFVHVPAFFCLSDNFLFERKSIQAKHP